MMVSAPATGPKEAPLSILAALGDQPQPQEHGNPGRALQWALGLFILVAACAAGMWSLRGPVTGPAPQPADVVAAAPVAVAASLALPAASAPGLPEPAPAASAARVAALEDLPGTAATSEPAASAAAAAPARQAAARRPAAKQPAVRVAQAAPKSTSARGSAALAAPAGALAAGSSVGGRADADVDLIAALVQHMDREAAATAGSADTSIANLVGRCKSLAGEEALRCQRRICDNYWGRAEACPRSLAPASARNELAARP